jgi:hypothetical protein
MRRFQALNSTTLLIDQDRRLAADRLSQCRHQGTDLVWSLAVTLKQDEAARIAGGEELPFLGRQPRAGAPENDGPGLLFRAV